MRSLVCTLAGAPRGLKRCCVLTSLGTDRQTALTITRRIIKSSERTTGIKG